MSQFINGCDVVYKLTSHVTKAGYLKALYTSLHETFFFRLTVKRILLDKFFCLHAPNSILGFPDYTHWVDKPTPYTWLRWFTKVNFVDTKWSKIHMD